MTVRTTEVERRAIMCEEHPGYYGPNMWLADRDNITTLARWLVSEGQLMTIEDVLYFFEKPWKWTPEWREYRAQANARIGAVSK